MLSVPKKERIKVLSLLYSGQPVPISEQTNHIMLDLIETHLVATRDDPFSAFLTYAGFKELENWDPVLEVSLDHYALLPNHGNA